ncbi:hypothetical protein T492DRAFT_521821 [Pavlovales sp. CCMP2436]|nr:hypothetical protein T492DRAFT_521821 [Pavlovales sp. CCMP2436]
MVTPAAVHLVRQGSGWALASLGRQKRDSLSRLSERDRQAISRMSDAGHPSDRPDLGNGLGEEAGWGSSDGSGAPAHAWDTGDVVLLSNVVGAPVEARPALLSWMGAADTDGGSGGEMVSATVFIYSSFMYHFQSLRFNYSCCHCVMRITTLCQICPTRPL